MMKRSQSGFTLIEMMLVVALVSILAGIAYPSYQSHLTKSRRIDGQGALTSFANAMERYYTENYTYTGAAAGGANTGAPAATVFPSEAPVDGSTKYYDLTIEDSAATTFTLRATPKSVQSGDGYLELTSTGQRRWDENNDNAIGAGEDDWK